METNHFSAIQWKARCMHWARDCQDRSLSPTHLYMILGQRIDAELDTVPLEHRDEAIVIAAEVGYDPRNERAELQRWLLKRHVS